MVASGVVCGGLRAILRDDGSCPRCGGEHDLSSSEHALGDWVEVESQQKRIPVGRPVGVELLGVYLALHVIAGLVQTAIGVATVDWVHLTAGLAGVLGGVSMCWAILNGKSWALFVLLPACGLFAVGSATAILLEQLEVSPLWIAAEIVTVSIAVYLSTPGVGRFFRNGTVVNV